MKKALLVFLILCNVAVSRETFIGPCCPLFSKCANVFSYLTQAILPGDPLIFESLNVETKEVDLSLISSLGMVRFNRDGVYKVIWNLAGQLFLPDDSFGWSFGLILDGTIIPGSVFGEHSSQFSQKVGGAVMIRVKEGQCLSLINTSSKTVNVISENKNTKLPLASATLCISCIEPL